MNGIQRFVARLIFGVDGAIILTQGGQIMVRQEQLNEKLDRIEQAIEAEHQQVAEGMAKLHAEIQALRDAGPAIPQEEWDAALTRMDGLVTKVEAIIEETEDPPVDPEL